MVRGRGREGGWLPPGGLHAGQPGLQGAFPFPLAVSLRGGERWPGKQKAAAAAAPDDRDQQRGLCSFRGKQTDKKKKKKPEVHFPPFSSCLFPFVVARDGHGGMRRSEERMLPPTTTTSPLLS